jgi:cysteine desulfurase/selenocysteine lyase
MGLNLDKIRSQFNCLNQKTKGKYPIYFDNACMTLKPNSVLEKMTDYYQNHPSCHNRAIHSFGKETSQKFSQARSKTQKFLNAKSPKEIVFTKNTTEGLNLLANGIKLNKGDVVLTSDFEHNSNLLPWQFLSQKKEIVHKTYSINYETGVTDLSEYEEILKQGNVKVVSTFHTSHVTGITQPIQEMCSIAHKYGAVFILDAAQALAHEQIDVQKLDIDFMAFSFHKVFGPTGMGCLYGKEDLLRKLTPFITGGETVLDTDYGTCSLADIPERFEAGLQNYAGAIGAGEAIDFLSKFNFKHIKQHELELNSYMTEEISKFSNIKVLGPEDPALRGSILNIRVDGFDSGQLSILLDQTNKIMVRSGVHCCHAYFHKHGLKPTLRFSSSIYNGLNEAEQIVKTMHEVLKFF